MEKYNEHKFIEKEAYLFNTGEHFYSYRFLGSHERKGGYQFTLWAPYAQEVKVYGDFSWWHGISLKPVGDTQMWTVFVPGALAGQFYKYKITQQDGKKVMKSDPFALQSELRPKDASQITAQLDYKWQDEAWLKQKEEEDPYAQALNIYEIHQGSWRTHPDGSFYTYLDLIDTLIPYVISMHYTHIELMPLLEHPLDASWGYQTLSYFSITSRYGSLSDFLRFVDACHAMGIGVIMDWIPGHFCRNDIGLALFDGTAQYEYAEKKKADNQAWGTSNFDLGKPQVQSFLISSALFLLDYCHLDGLRVDAVSNMLYLDYEGSSEIMNEDGSNHNRDGVEFLKRLNTSVQKMTKGKLMIAEESTEWDGVSRAVNEGGLGFTYKWNMGWMNDILRFFAIEPIYRIHEFNLLTFSFVYMMNEHYVLALSHDEVVHGKKSLMHKMPGSQKKQLANLRLLYAFTLIHPGKKLLFMGGEFGQFLEWNFADELVWQNASDTDNKKTKAFVETLNETYLLYPSLWRDDASMMGVTILYANAPIIAMMRHDEISHNHILAIFNFEDQEVQDFELSLPYKGTYELIINSQSTAFGGTWTQTPSVETPIFKTTLPALGALIYSMKER